MERACSAVSCKQNQLVFYTPPAGFIHMCRAKQQSVSFASKPHHTAQPLAVPLGSSPCSRSWGDFMGQFYVVS